MQLSDRIKRCVSQLKPLQFSTNRTVRLLNLDSLWILMSSQRIRKKVLGIWQLVLISKLNSYIPLLLKWHLFLDHSANKGQLLLEYITNYSTYGMGIVFKTKMLPVSVFICLNSEDTWYGEMNLVIPVFTSTYLPTICHIDMRCITTVCWLL